MMGPLRTIWAAPAASPPPPRRVWRDWALVGILVPTIIIEALARHYYGGLPWPWLQALVTLGLVATLLWRRTHPLLMFTIAFVASTVLTFVTGPDEQFVSSVFLLLVGYCIFRWGSGRDGIIGLGLLVGVSVVSSIFDSHALPDVISNVVGSTAILSATIALALVFRTRASARVREVEQAKSLQREELARDLHDTVAHHVSAIAIQAQAGLATVAANPAAATEALRVIEREASRTLAEMRAMVRVLRRDDSVDLTPSHRIDDIEGLASTHPGGPVVTVQISGDVSSVPPPVAAAIYRIAQESVTNARRHARNATRINVIVSCTSSEVTIVVRDDGESTPGTVPGYGITGMTERATLLGGTFTADRGKRGWTVTAALPLTGWNS
jgi:signal transduction histidine kinase